MFKRFGFVAGTSIIREDDLFLALEHIESVEWAKDHPLELDPPADMIDANGDQVFIIFKIVMKSGNVHHVWTDNNFGIIEDLIGGVKD